MVLLTMAGCGSSPTASTAGTVSASPATAAVSSSAPSAASPSAAPPAATGGSSTGRVSLRFTVKDGVSTPAPDRREIGRGQQVEISVESAGPIEVHVHGYDLRAEAKPGKPAVIRFVADRTGRFDVEAHPDTLLVQLVVR